MANSVGDFVVPRMIYLDCFDVFGDWLPKNAPLVLSLRQTDYNLAYVYEAYADSKSSELQLSHSLLQEGMQKVVSEMINDFEAVRRLAIKNNELATAGELSRVLNKINTAFQKVCMGR